MLFALGDGATLFESYKKNLTLNILHTSATILQIRNSHHRVRNLENADNAVLSHNVPVLNKTYLFLQSGFSC